jgi:hypothetical protein
MANRSLAYLKKGVGTANRRLAGKTRHYRRAQAKVRAQMHGCTAE